VSNDAEWIRRYRAALNEADAGKRLTRIDEAERTLKQALRQAIERGDSTVSRSQLEVEGAVRANILRDPLHGRSIPC
jgi:hypothetical protein